jgi:hypothetical protein
MNQPKTTASRRHERREVLQRISWDFFTAASGAKTALMANISEGGCLLKSSDPIEHRRWIRLMIREGDSNVFRSAVGRVIRCERGIEATAGEITLYRYGVEFVQPHAAPAVPPTLPLPQAGHA